jgi:WG containing repeat
MTKGFCPRILSLFLLLLALFVNIRAQSTPPQRFVIWDERGKFGYIDETGKIIIEPQFDVAYPFTEGVAAVRIGDKAGFINPSGQVVVPLRYHSTYPFSDGVAGVSVVAGVGENQQSPCGYIDHAGQYVIKPQTRFSCSASFHEGNAAVRIYDKQVGEWLGTYIDKQGRAGLRNNLAVAEPFSEGLALVNNFANWFFINDQGQAIIELTPQYREDTFADRYEPAGSFSEGLAKVGIIVAGSAGYSIYAFMNRKGQILFKLPDHVTPQGDFHDGRARVYVSLSRTVSTLFEGQIYRQEENVSGRGFIDQTGKIVIEPRFSRVEDFSEGLAVVRVGKGLPIDDYNITPERWQTVYAKNEAKHYSCIDRGGKVVIEKCGAPLSHDEIAKNFQQFGRAFGRGFVDELFFSKTSVQVAGKVKTVYGYMNRSGKYVWVQPLGTKITPLE